MIRARLNTKPNKTSVVQVYSPTNEAEDDVELDFYDALQAELEKIPKHDLTIIMGVFNAKEVQDNTGYERVMEKCGSGAINENDEYLADFCGKWNIFPI